MMQANRGKRVHIIATGGTIAGVGEAGFTGGYQPGVLSIGRLVEGLPTVEQVADVTGEQFASLNSDDITQAHWLAIVNRIQTLWESGRYDGFVITHGTDTLEESAYFFHLTVKCPAPVVLTGAMRPATATSADGPLNLLQSIALAASDQARGHGVLVAFNEGIYSARDVRKGNSFRTHAITGGDMGTLGIMRDLSPVFYHLSLKKHTLDTEFDVRGMERLPDVAVASFHVDARSEIVDYLAGTHQALVIEGAGDGQVSRSWEERMRYWAAKGLPIVRATRVPDGSVYRGAGMPDDEMGTVAAGTLSPEKARVLLMLALTRTKDPGQIQAMFDRY